LIYLSSIYIDFQFLFSFIDIYNTDFINHYIMYHKLNYKSNHKNDHINCSKQCCEPDNIYECIDRRGCFDKRKSCHSKAECITKKKSVCKSVCKETKSDNSQLFDTNTCCKEKNGLDGKDGRDGVDGQKGPRGPRGEKGADGAGSTVLFFDTPCDDEPVTLSPEELELVAGKLVKVTVRGGGGAGGGGFFDIDLFGEYGAGGGGGGSGKTETTSITIPLDASITYCVANGGVAALCDPELPLRQFTQAESSHINISAPNFTDIKITGDGGITGSFAIISDGGSGSGLPTFLIRGFGGNSYDTGGLGGGGANSLNNMITPTNDLATGGEPGLNTKFGGLPGIDGMFGAGGGGGGFGGGQGGSGLTGCNNGADSTGDYGSGGGGGSGGGLGGAGKSGFIMIEVLN
jgi:hypothetical protein